MGLTRSQIMSINRSFAIAVYTVSPKAASQCSSNKDAKPTGSSQPTLSDQHWWMRLTVRIRLDE